MRDLMLLRQTAGTLNAADVATLNAYADPQQPVLRLNTVTNGTGAAAPPQ